MVGVLGQQLLPGTGSADGLSAEPVAPCVSSAGAAAQVASGKSFQTIGAVDNSGANTGQNTDNTGINGLFNHGALRRAQSLHAAEPSQNPSMRLWPMQRCFCMLPVR